MSPVDPFELESDDGGIITEDEDLRRNTLNNAGSLEGALPVKPIIPLDPFPYPLKYRNGTAQPTIEPSKRELESFLGGKWMTDFADSGERFEAALQCGRV